MHRLRLRDHDQDFWLTDNSNYVENGEFNMKFYLILTVLTPRWNTTSRHICIRLLYSKYSPYPDPAHPLSLSYSLSLVSLPPAFHVITGISYCYTPASDHLLNTHGNTNAYEYVQVWTNLISQLTQIHVPIVYHISLCT